MRTHGAVVGRRFRSVMKLTTKVRIGRGYLWGSFLIAAAALKTPTRNGYNAQDVNFKFYITAKYCLLKVEAYGCAHTHIDLIIVISMVIIIILHGEKDTDCLELPCTVC